MHTEEAYDILDHEQIFNSDETGFPKKEWQVCSKKGLMVELSFVPNVTGNIEFPPLFIGKSAHPCCFRSIDIDRTTSCL